MENKKWRVMLFFEITAFCLLVVHYKTTEFLTCFQKIKASDIVTIETQFEEELEVYASRPRVIEESEIKREKVYNLNETDYMNLLRIVEAEATGEDLDGKLLVANVVLNRVKSPKFPNTVTDVVFQGGDSPQFSPTKDGRIYSVKITESTYQAVENAIYGQDISQNALYFVSASRTTPEKLSWFESKLKYLFTHGGHQFYK